MDAFIWANTIQTIHIFVSTQKPASDPVGVLGEVSSIFTGGGGIVKTVGKGGQVISRTLVMGKEAKDIAAMSKGIEAIGQLSTKIGTITDPLTIPSKAAGIGLNAALQSPILLKKIATQKSVVFKSSVAASRIKSGVGYGATQQASEK